MDIFASGQVIAKHDPNQVGSKMIVRHHVQGQDLFFITEDFELVFFQFFKLNLQISYSMKTSSAMTVGMRSSFIWA